MRPIVLFQTFVNIVLGATVLFLLNQVDSKVESILGVEVTAAQSLDEALRMNETLTQILAALRESNSERAAGLDR